MGTQRKIPRFGITPASLLDAKHRLENTLGRTVSLREMSRITGVSRQTLSDIMHGKVLGMPDTADRIVAGLRKQHTNIDSDDLIVEQE